MDIEEEHTPREDSDYSLAPFFELSADLLCIAGFDGYFKKINQSVSKTLGYTEEELLSKPIHAFIHPDDRNVTARYRSQILQGKPLLNFENRYLTKDGDVVWLSWTSMPFLEKKRVYAIAKNITHKKQQEARRNQKITELTKVNQRLKQLNYTTSHDLRTPVGNLLAIFSMMDTTNIHDAETLEFIQLLKTASENLKSTLDKFVDDASRNQALPIEVQEIDLPEILEQVRHSLRSLIEGSNTRFHVDFRAYQTVSFNPSYMESILMNLISNSIKYAHPDRDPAITIQTEVSKGEKRLVFSDNGLGFDSDELKNRVFGLHEKFHDHADSKGIGLYLVYNQVTSLGGHISVDSEVNRGTTFTISFRHPVEFYEI